MGYLLNARPSSRASTVRPRANRILVLIGVLLGLASAAYDAGATIPGRQDLGMIYDPVRDRLVVFGGLGASGALGDLWELPLSGPLVWAPLAASGPGPSPRYQHTALYDPAGDRLLVWGGQDGTNTYSELWELSLAGTPAWSLVPTSGTPPFATVGVTLDTYRDRLIAPTRQLPLATGAWNVLTTSSIPGSDIQLAYDVRWDRVWALTSWSDYDRTTRLLSGVAMVGLDDPAWRLVETIVPVYVSDLGVSVVFDPVRTRVLAYGGVRTYYFPPGGDGIGNVTRTFGASNDFSYRVLAVPGVLPPPRADHASVYDAARDRMIVFGGSYGPASQFRSDAWALSFSEPPVWEELQEPTAGTGDAGVVDYALGRVSPNPTRGVATIEFTVAREAPVRLGIVDLQGRQVALLADGVRPAGRYQVAWNGKTERGVAPGGVYFVVYQAPGKKLARRLVLTH